MALKIGILSDTHLTGCSETFIQLINHAFHGCSIIIHAGDITDMSVLHAFSEKTLVAVHGNMCSLEVKKQFPASQLVTLDGYAIAVCHGAGLHGNIEELLFSRFHEADCIIYGHTHRPVSHRFGSTLFVNPGSFSGTGRYGAPGTYALLETGVNQLEATIHTLPEQQ